MRVVLKVVGGCGDGCAEGSVGIGGGLRRRVVVEVVTKVVRGCGEGDAGCPEGSWRSWWRLC